jgi:hypothetical protein
LHTGTARSSTGWESELTCFTKKSSFLHFLHFPAGVGAYMYSNQPFIFLVYILSTGLNPNTRMPLLNTCRAATYSASRASMTPRSLVPTTCK